MLMVAWYYSNQESELLSSEETIPYTFDLMAFSFLFCLSSKSLREDFQKAIARMHAHPEVGKNRLDSFLALPMQRLTRLKLLVEVIQKLQTVVASEAEEQAVKGSTETMTPGGNDACRRMKITKEHLENSSIALKELKRVGFG